MRPSIEECRKVLSSAQIGQLPALVRRLSQDPRSGVADAVAVAKRRIARARAESRRLVELGHMEADLRASGVGVVAGVDEVGRGSLAGPLTAAAVVLPPALVIEGLDDSKKLTPEKREALSIVIRRDAVAFSIAHVSAEEIDHFGMTQVVRLAMRRALDGLGIEVGHVLVDGNDGNIGYPSTAVIGGDSKVAAIAAASVVAKVERDALMVELDAEYPGYGFAAHKGYSTEDHFAALRDLGPSSIHRRSFSPCREDSTLF